MREFPEPPCIVELEGDIDELTIKHVITTLNAVAKQGSAAVVVSFERSVNFESSLLKELMRIGQVLTAAERRLLIVMPRDHPGRHIFHLLNLDKRWECFESRALALSTTSYEGLSRGSDRDRLSSWAPSNAARS
jgi:hypothetical protein